MIFPPMQRPAEKQLVIAKLESGPIEAERRWTSEKKGDGDATKALDEIPDVITSKPDRLVFKSGSQIFRMPETFQR
jgi:hypothetical protein